MSVYRGQEKVLNSITAVEEAKVKEIVGNEMTTKGVCTTKVADVPLTTITFSDESKYKVVNNSLSYYYVKNGVCYVQLYAQCLEIASDYTFVFSDLPPIGHTRIDTVAPWGDYSSITTPVNALGYNVSGKGLHLCFGSVGITYLFSFSYPVAES